MEPIEANLLDHDAWATEALRILRRMAPASQERVLRHLFQVIAYVDHTDDVDAAVRLCHDMSSTVRLHSESAYLAAVENAELPSGSRVSLETVLASLGA